MTTQQLRAAIDPGVPTGLGCSPEMLRKQGADAMEPHAVHAFLFLISQMPRYHDGGNIYDE